MIGELIYTIRKGRKVSGKKIGEDKIQMIASTLISSSNFIIQDLTIRGWEIFIELKVPELHNRLIVATCKQENVNALLTTDVEIIDSREILVIWE